MQVALRHVGGRRMTFEFMGFDGPRAILHYRMCGEYLFSLSRNSFFGRKDLSEWHMVPEDLDHLIHLARERGIRVRITPARKPKPRPRILKAPDPRQLCFTS